MNVPGFDEHRKAAIEQLVRRLASEERCGAALGEAARWGRKDLLEELLSSDLDVDSRSESGATPLMLAASGGRTAIVKWLIEQGADVNAQDDVYGNSPLIWCLSARHPARIYMAICRALLDAGASPSERAKDGRTALDWAKEGRPPETLSLLEEYGTIADY